MKVVNTYTATIYVGFKERDTGIIHTLDECKEICQRYVDEVGLGVTVTSTEYTYTNGSEPGAAIGLINYPRFPSFYQEILDHALKLGESLMLAFSQYKVSIVTPSVTYMLENPNMEAE